MTDDIQNSGEVLDTDENEEPKKCMQERYTLALMGFFCFFVLSALRLNISIAIVAMVNWTKVRENQGFDPTTSESCHYPESAERSEKEDGPFVWPTEIQGHILGSYFYGLSATQFLAGRLSEAFSAKWVLLLGTLLATASTLLVPIAATDAAYGVIILQICKGFGQGVLMPSFSVLMGKWIPADERARFMFFITSGIPVGGFLSAVLSGFICNTPFLGWKYVFYIFGAVGAVWCVLWFFLVHDSPLSDPHITRRELNRIMSLRSQKAPQLRYPVPIKAILTSKPVWAYIAAGFASFWCLSLYISVVPLFMGTILKYDIEKNGALSAVPNLVEVVFLIIASVISDYLLKKKIFKATTIRKIFISTGLCGYAICMVVVTFTGCNRILSVFFLVVALGTSGFSFASTAVVPVDMSPRFAGTISGIMNTFGALSGVLIPAAIGYLTQKRGGLETCHYNFGTPRSGWFPRFGNLMTCTRSRALHEEQFNEDYQTLTMQTMDEWSIIFYASATICVFAVIIFAAFGSSETQTWNNPPQSNVSGQPSESSTPGPSSQKVLLSSGGRKKSKTTVPKTKAGEISGRKKSMKRQPAMDDEQENDERTWRDTSFPPLPSPRRPSVYIPEDWDK